MKQVIIKTVLILLVFETILYGLYQYFRINCTPCPPNQKCPPCISDEQSIIIDLFIIIPLVAIGYLLYVNKERIKTATENIN
jgi:hypothetical protein